MQKRDVAAVTIRIPHTPIATVTTNGKTVLVGLWGAPTIHSCEDSQNEFPAMPIYKNVSKSTVNPLT